MPSSSRRCRPRRDTSPSSIFLLDILGEGTACLSWADASSSSDQTEILYLDLAGSVIPRLLEQYGNSLEAVISLDCDPLTRFYFADAAAGKPWSTRIPFPVQCVSQVEVTNGITGDSNTTRYAYQNGIYDPFEKEFARVRDGEAVDE